MLTNNDGQSFHEIIWKFLLSEQMTANKHEAVHFEVHSLVLTKKV